MPDQFRAVTFSVMATRGHQAGRKGIAAHPSAAPWERRRNICLRYMKQGGVDFIGLKHCYFSKNSSRSALDFFLDGLNSDNQDYGCFNAVLRPSPGDSHRGDSLPIIYNKRLWEIDTSLSGEVWHKAPIPEAQPGGHGHLFNYAVFRRIIPDDTIRPHLLRVYNIRMRDKHTYSLDIYRALCFGEILEHIHEFSHLRIPAVLLCDTNCKVVGSIADKLIQGLPVSCKGINLSPKIVLRDSYLELHPDAHGKVRTQHNFVSPGSIEGDERNNRILLCGNLEVVDAIISLYQEDGCWPSYHYPVEVGLRVILRNDD